MFFSFLLCFLTLIFSIHFISIPAADATNKFDSTSCNPWEVIGCSFSNDYLNELVKYFKYNKVLPNTYYKPPEYVIDIVKVAEDLGEDAAMEAIEKFIEDRLADEAAKTFVKRIGFLLDILNPSDIYPDSTAKKNFCKKNPDMDYCSNKPFWETKYCKKNSHLDKCKPKPKSQNWTCEVNADTGKIECISSPLKPNWVCGINPITGKDECVDSNKNPKPIKPNLRDCDGLDLYDGSYISCISQNNEEVMKYVKEYQKEFLDSTNCDLNGVSCIKPQGGPFESAIKPIN